jgi:short-subunit dehydrogenase
MAPRTFRNKAVVITGAASGIGRALALRFARAGARLGLLDIDAGGLGALSKAIDPKGVRVFTAAADVGVESDCRRAMEALKTRLGGIDVLVANAGITARGPFEGTRAEVFAKVMAVNFFGSLYCTQAVLDSLRARCGMIIVNESIAAMAPVLGRSAYCASKHALHGLFTTLRAELRGSGVDVLIVCPGFTATALQTRALGPDGRVTARNRTMAGAEHSAQQVAEAIFAAAVQNKRQLVMTFVGRLTVWMNRLAPALYERLMAKRLRAEIEP